MGNQTISAVRRTVMAAVILVASVAIVAADAREAAAQAPTFGGGTSQLPLGSFGTPAALQLNSPVVSPFLSLAQPGINPAVAYQTLVVPQLQLGNAVTANQQQIGDLRRSVSQSQSSMQPGPFMPLQTGHPSVFLNTFSYFPAVSLRPSQSGH
jgi:hypothetical protein